MQLKKLFSIVAIVVIATTLLVLHIHPVSAYERFETRLDAVSGAKVDVRDFTFSGHVVSKGFTTDISMMMPTGTGSESRTRIGFAVANLASSWAEYGSGYSVVYWPYVKEMSLKIQGDDAYTGVSGDIYDNAGTASSPTEFIAILDWLGDQLVPYGITGLLKDLYTNPPSREWQLGDHWIRAIDRQQTIYIPSYGTVIFGNRTQTATAFLSSYLDTHGYRTLTITAQAQIYVEGHWTMQDPYSGGEISYPAQYPVDTYSVSFQVTPVADEAPYAPLLPNGPGTGHRYTSYPYFIVATDTEMDAIKYRVFWDDSTSTDTGFINSGQGLNVTHSWSAPGTYDVYARAQDIYGLWSDKSPVWTVNIVNRPPNPPDPPVGASRIFAGMPNQYVMDGTTTDPDLDNVYYRFTWGDGETSLWYGPFPSGYYTCVGGEHIWAVGTYSLTVQAKDVYGLISTSSPLTVNVVPLFTTLTVYSGTGGTTSPAAGTYSYEYGCYANVMATASPGYLFRYWSLDGTTYYSNPISVQMTDNHYLTPHYGTDGGGGCPYVYNWNGSSFVKDNNLLPASEDGNGTDTKDYYRLEQQPVPIIGTRQTTLYALQIREFEKEIDYFDEVKLIALDHSIDTDIAMTPEGEILTYTDPESPISCNDNHGTDRLSEIATMNGNINDPTTYFQGFKGDSLVLNFGKVTGPYAKLIIRDDQKCTNELCINLQVPDGRGGWLTIEVLNPRDLWSMEAVDMAAYVPKTDDFKVRLLWTSTHRLDYVGLDTSSPAQVKETSSSPILAIHSTLGDVRARLLYDDQECVKLVSGQQMTMMFTLPNNVQGTTRDFILYTNGYYYTITP